MRTTSLLTALVLIWFGGSGVAGGLSNREIAEFAFHTYQTEKPDAEWVRLTGVGLDVAGASYTESSQGAGIQELIVPLRRADAEVRGAVGVFLATRDPSTIREFEKLQEVSEEEVEAYYFANLERLFVRAPVEGMVEVAFAHEKGRRALLEARDDVLPDCALIREDAQPRSIGLSAGMLGLGVLMVAGKFFLLRG